MINTITHTAALINMELLASAAPTPLFPATRIRSPRHALPHDHTTRTKLSRHNFIRANTHNTLYSTSTNSPTTLRSTFQRKALHCGFHTHPLFLTPFLGPPIFFDLSDCTFSIASTFHTFVHNNNSLHQSHPHRTSRSYASATHFLELPREPKNTIFSTSRPIVKIIKISSFSRLHAMVSIDSFTH